MISEFDWKALPQWIREKKKFRMIPSINSRPLHVRTTMSMHSHTYSLPKHKETHTHVYTYVLTNIHIYVFTCSHTHMNIPMCSHTHIPMCSHFHTHTHMHIPMCSHVHTHMNIPMCSHVHKHTWNRKHLIIILGTQHCPLPLISRKGVYGGLQFHCLNHDLKSQRLKAVRGPCLYTMLCGSA